MAKSLTAGMLAHLQETTTSLTSLWRIIRRDGQEFYFTDHDQDITFDDGDGSQTYLASGGYSRTALTNRATLEVDNLDIEGVFNTGEVEEADVLAGLFDYAEARIMLVNWQDLTDGMIRLKKGFFGEVIATNVGMYRTEFRGLTQLLSQKVLEIYSPECRADLGDARCGVPIRPDILGRNTAVTVGQFYRVNTGGGSDDLQESFENRVYEVTTAGTTAGSQPSYDTTIDNTTADGTAVLTARDSFTRHAVIASVVDDFNVTITVTEARAIDDWFNGGAIIMEEGQNAGVVREVVDWTQTGGALQLFLKFPFPVVATEKCRIYPGCDKRLATCKARFANVINFRGEPHVPGPDTTLEAKN